MLVDFGEEILASHRTMIMAILKNIVHSRARLVGERSRGRLVVIWGNVAGLVGDNLHQHLGPAVVLVAVQSSLM